jgi:hypothetical protein
VSWTENVSGGGILNIAAIDLFSDSSTPAFFYDDISLVASSLPEFPTVECATVQYLPSGCAEFSWSVTNGNLTDPITTFYLDVEAGTGAQICTDLSDMVPPAGYAYQNCTGWVNGHALFQFTGPPFLPGQAVYGRLTVDTNGATETVTDTGLTVPPYSIIMHAAKDQAGAVCATGDFSFGPTVGEEEWSLPTVCTAFLPVPSMGTWAKVVLALVVIGCGVYLVVRSRRPVTA